MVFQLILMMPLLILSMMTRRVRSLTLKVSSVRDHSLSLKFTFFPVSIATRRYGMHENYDYYQVCRYTERNKGLYTADQLVQRNDRRGTRQNPVGNRHGLECPEERDYYPWWAPSPWIDIAVLTDSGSDEVCYPYSNNCTTRCYYYMNNTMNFNKKGYCDVVHNSTTHVATKINNRFWQQNKWFNNRAACERNGFHWYEVSHSDNIMLANNSFVCAKTQYARVNQLGNAQSEDAVVSQNARSGVVNSHISENLNANRFMWTIPTIPTAVDGTDYFSSMTNAYKSCTLRMRYNISSADFQSWPKEAHNAGFDRMVDSKNNSRYAYDPNTPLSQDPFYYIGPGDSASKGQQFVKLKVNTNQYARTFQDRSYVFSIKPLPTSYAAASTKYDTPEVDAASIQAALASGGKIYNVNVRGKRGNIVQVYPSVEYDFVPNALALSENDMIHFQWTGSDYNPRRGCNDATGGPPDANTFFTDANANQNPRADRSNVILTDHMGVNTPRDYLGYDHTDGNYTYQQQLAMSNKTILENSPCYNNNTDTSTVATQCRNTIMRLAYLNQQSDSGSLILRQGRNCLTQDELDAFSNQDVSDFHPLNCAKMNAKPYPYFDGGIMFMRKNGWFPYFSSRNNNFSNRQQIGVICVGPTCTVDANGILQDKNPQIDGTTITRASSSPSSCYNTANPVTGANANAAHSCLPTTANVSIESYIITYDTQSTAEGDTDSKGDGNSKGCAVLDDNLFAGNTVERNIALAFILLAVGLFFSWLAYFLYNRYQARRTGESKFRYDTAWQSAAPVEKRANRPASQNFSESNPGIKMTRPTKSAREAPASSGAASPPKAAAPAKAARIQRTDMI